MAEKHTIQTVPTRAYLAELAVFDVDFFLDTQCFTHSFMYAGQAIGNCVAIRAVISHDSAANPTVCGVSMKL